MCFLGVIESPLGVFHGLAREFMRCEVVFLAMVRGGCKVSVGS